MIRSADEIKKMRRAGRVVAEMMEKTRQAIAPGVTTVELDRIAREVLERRSAKSNLLDYHGFPSVICTSPNSVVIHGIPGAYVLEEGDIISVDCGAEIDGYHGDAAYTAPVGEISHLKKRLIAVTERSLWAGIDVMKEGRHLHEVGKVIQKIVESAGFFVVREYVGHGIGTQIHEEPDVPNYWPGSPGPVLKAGNVFAVEPMVIAGSSETVVARNGWSVVASGGHPSAHFEHTVAITADGPEVLTVF
jgi:methionyl aminopeptidase